METTLLLSQKHSSFVSKNHWTSYEQAEKVALATPASFQILSGVSLHHIRCYQEGFGEGNKVTAMNNHAGSGPSSAKDIMATIAVGVIQMAMFIYDFFTFPIYYAAQRPWSVNKTRIRADIIHRTDSEVLLRPRYQTCDKLEEFKVAGIDTMDKCWKYAVDKHMHKRMVGTREVLREEKEIQANGGVVTKLIMGEYHWKTYLVIDKMATNFGRGLRELGLNRLENIGIFAETKEEWLVCALSCFKQTFPLVTLYPNLGEDAITYGINQTEVTHVITTHDLLPKFKKILPQTPTVKYLIFIEDQITSTEKTGYKDGVTLHSFRELCDLGGTSNASAVPPNMNDPAIIMYTSGSTGVPKGVVLPHEALVATVKATHLIGQPKRPGDIYLGYLPLAHILELLSEINVLVQGVPIGYSSPSTMIDNSCRIKVGHKGDCSVLKPSGMSAVPLVIDRIYKGILEQIHDKGIFLEKLMIFFLKYKSFYRQQGMTTPILDTLIFKKFRALVGGRLRLMLSGGAPLSPDTHDIVRNALSLPLIQGYGLTETCSVGTIMESDELTTGRVGPPMQGIEIKLINWEGGNYLVTDSPNPRGEIVIGGKNIATGYYKMPDKTMEDFSQDEMGCRWFRTGDIGEIFPDGTLKIIDRMKDLVKLQSGEYVSLGKVEALLKTCSLVENICIYGDPSKYSCVALVMCVRKHLMTLGEHLGLKDHSFKELCISEEVRSAVFKEITAHSKKVRLERFEIPGAITLVQEPWTPESGLVTAVFKLRRKQIQDYYTKELQKMYTITK